MSGIRGSAGVECGKGVDTGLAAGFGRWPAAGGGKGGLDSGFGKGFGTRGAPLAFGKGKLDSGFGKGLEKGIGLGKGVSKGFDNDVDEQPCPEHLLPAVSRNRNYFTVGISSDIISAVRRATAQHANS